MDFAGMLAGIKEVLANEGAQTRRDILFLVERMGNIQGQLDQTNYRLTDLSTRMDHHFSDLSRRIDGVREELGQRIDGMALRIDGLGQRFDNIRAEHGERIARVEQAIEGVQRRAPDEAA
ncbi:MAG: hypothetical protein FJX76_16820 [Armatimonadetes bacterium]|nr:hypothetical protein [Armatimonadota bacterium]